MCPLSHNCIIQWTPWLVVEAEKIQLIKIRKEEPLFIHSNHCSA
nr:MAG TPA: hypothetical protein [Caudoviricetes sp.]